MRLKKKKKTETTTKSKCDRGLLIRRKRACMKRIIKGNERKEKKALKTVVERKEISFHPETKKR